MTRNLLYLNNLKENVEELDLNFTVDINEFGETRSVELKPGGKEIAVTIENKIEYIHLLADYKLNRQVKRLCTTHLLAPNRFYFVEKINEQVIAFKNGMSNIIDLDFLRLFNFHELQNLISGSDETIDVDDWQRNTVYSGEIESSVLFGQLLHQPSSKLFKTATMKTTWPCKPSGRS
jgi:ubiquitin-protein ligase E3 C